MPSYATNCIEGVGRQGGYHRRRDLKQDMRPSAASRPVQMYYERLLSAAAKRTVKELFPITPVFALRRRQLRTLP